MSTTRVVIGDDDRAFREAIDDVLSADSRFTVVGSAASGGELRQLAAELRPDIALVDIRMPEGGPSAVRGLLQDHGERHAAHVDPPSRQLVVVAVSAHTSASEVRDMIMAGASGYLAKGGLGAALPDLVHRCASGEVVLAVPTGSKALAMLVGAAGHGEQ